MVIEKRPYAEVQSMDLEDIDTFLGILGMVEDNKAAHMKHAEEQGESKHGRR